MKTKLQYHRHDHLKYITFVRREKPHKANFMDLRTKTNCMVWRMEWNETKRNETEWNGDQCEKKN